MEITGETRVGDIVSKNFTSARVFEANHIDFCCGGNISISEAAAKEGVDLSKLLSELSSVLNKEDRDSGLINSLSLSGLCEHIVETHHSYVNDAVPFLQQKLQKLCDVHGDRHPELFEVHATFSEAAANLAAHMKKEELVLFPHIRKLEKFRMAGGERPENIGLAASAIQQMEAEHEAEGERFKKLSGITNNYELPPDGCNTFEVSYKTLKEFEIDLHRHIHLENNILFPKAIKLEKLLDKT